MTALTFELFSGDDLTDLPLYTDYSGQESSAYLCLDLRDGRVWCKEKAPHDNTWSSAEHLGHIATWEIPNSLTGTGLNALMQNPDLTPLLIELCDGSEEFWDGNNYRRGLKSKDYPNMILDKLELFFENVLPEDYDHLEPWDAFMFFQDSIYSELIKDGEEHNVAARRLQSEARREGVYLSWQNTINALDTMKEEIRLNVE